VSIVCSPWLLGNVIPSEAGHGLKLLEVPALASPFFINCLVEQSVNHAAFNETKADCSHETAPEISMVEVLLPVLRFRQSDSHEFREGMKNVRQMCVGKATQKKAGAALRVIALLSPFNQLNFVQIPRLSGSLFPGPFIHVGAKVTQASQDGF